MIGRTPPGRGQGLVELQRLSYDLSDRDLAIITSVAEHRFLSTDQVERLHFLDHATQLSGSRSCRRVLRRLHQHHLLSALPRRVGGFKAGSGSSIWFGAPAGQRLLALRGATPESARRVREPSVRFVNHALAIAELRVHVVLAARSGQFGLSSVEIEPTSWRSYLAGTGVRETLKPDMAVTTTSRDGEFEDRWFVEVDLGTEHLPTVIRKCQQYEVYRRTGDEQVRHGVFPFVVWVTQDEERAAKLAGAIRAARSLDQRLFRALPAGRFVELVAGGTQ